MLKMKDLVVVVTEWRMNYLNIMFLEYICMYKLWKGKKIIKYFDYIKILT